MKKKIFLNLNQEDIELINQIKTSLELESSSISARVIFKGYRKILNTIRDMGSLQLKESNTSDDPQVVAYCMGYLTALDDLYNLM